MLYFIGNNQEDSMTEQERDNTNWNIIEVEAKYNVPHAAKVIASSMKYTEIPEFLTDYMVKEFSARPKEELADLIRHSTNDSWHYEFVEKGPTNYWMRSFALDHWHTNDEKGVQICHYIFFQRVA